MTETITFTAVQTPNLDTRPFRGSAPLAALDLISQADVFDQDSNADGLQREVSRKHAIDAYDYAAQRPDPAFPRAFPEVVLNVRDAKVLSVEDAGEVDGLKLVRLTFDVTKLERAKAVKVSRLDGNHRLLFGRGDGKDREPLDVPVPFQIHLGLSRDQEAALFLDINANQKGLNTSHLHSLRSRLTPEDVELQLHPERVFARMLATDATSPWNNLVHLGGSRAGAKDQGVRRPVNFVALESGVRRMLTKSIYLKEMVDGRYGLIRAYWAAVHALMPEAWERPGDYLVLKNIGVTAWATFGATVIDRSMATGRVEPDDMLALMADVPAAIDWHKDSPDVLGKSGNRAALYLAAQMVEALPVARQAVPA
jgi:DGQHR domain-containing protein